MLLGIDYGTTTTRAVLAGPDRRWDPVLFDGAPQLPSGVYLTTDGTLVPGQAGWQRALDDPGRYLAHPLAQRTDDTVEVAGQRLDPVDLIAATLRTVADAATAQAGAPPTQVRLVVPASWGPRRQSLVRRAVTRAGLLQPRLVPVAEAVVDGLAHAGTPIPVGASILVADFGAGRFEACVVAHLADGFEIISRITDPAGGAAAIDVALADHIATLGAALPHPETPAVRTDGSLRALAAATAAKQALGHTPALAVATPHRLPIVVDQPTLHTLAQPVLDTAVATSHRAIEAADLTPAQLAGVFCVGGGALMPAAVQALHEGLGLPVTVVPDPERAALRGAVDATGTAPSPPARTIAAGRPGVRHYLTATVPILAIAVLLWQTITTALPIHITDITSPIGSVITNWGAYAMIGLLATQAALAAATIIAAYLHAHTPTGDPNALSLPQLLPRLLPALPVAAAATLAGILAPRRPPPATTWTGWYTTPVTATAAGAAAMLLISFGHTNTDPHLGPATLPATLLGALLFAAATTMALPIGRGWRIPAALPLTFAAIALTLGYATGVLAVLYALTITTWWLTRTLRRSPAPHTGPTTPPPAAAPADTTRE